MQEKNSNKHGHPFKTALETDMNSFKCTKAHSISELYSISEMSLQYFYPTNIRIGNENEGKVRNPFLDTIKPGLLT